VSLSVGQRAGVCMWLGGGRGLALCSASGLRFGQGGAVGDCVRPMCVPCHAGANIDSLAVGLNIDKALFTIVVTGTKNTAVSAGYYFSPRGGGGDGEELDALCPGVGGGRNSPHLPRRCAPSWYRHQEHSSE
jgi:hypothetical protein